MSLTSAADAVVYDALLPGMQGCYPTNVKLDLKTWLKW